MTIGQLYAETSKTFEQAGVENFSFEASVLIEELLELSSTEFLMRKSESVDEGQRENILRAVQRRLSGEPLQYIIGSWDFYGCKITVGENVFIPRPETELLIERLAELPLPDNPKIADLCSGSGCIAIAAAKHHPKATVFSVELSEKAIGYIRKNVEINHAENVEIINRNVLDLPDPEKIEDEKFFGLDVILSNPPYVPSWEIQGLQKEVLREPHMALDGGEDGLDFYDAISNGWYAALKPGGMIMYEIGDKQAAGVSQILKSAGYKNIKVYQDYAGIERIVSAQK